MDIEIQAKEITRYRKLITKHTGQPLEKVAKGTDRDFILTADEAVEYAVVDEVISTRKMLPELASGRRKLVDETFVVNARRDGTTPWGTVALAPIVRIRETRAMRSRRHPPVRPASYSAFAGYRFPPEVITLAVRWYLRFGLSYRDVEELLAERGIEVDHVSIYRWVQRFAPEFAEAARARQHVIGDRWHVDETYVKVGGSWRYLFRALDQFGRVIDVYLSPRRDAKAARHFLERAIDRTRISPVEVTTDRYRVYPRALDELLPAAFHDTEVHANNALETDHGRLKARLRPMRGLKRDRTARVIVAAHAFIQNLRRGFYDLGTDVRPPLRLTDAFAELAHVI